MFRVLIRAGGLSQIANGCGGEWIAVRYTSQSDDGDDDDDDFAEAVQAKENLKASLSDSGRDVESG